MDYYKKIKTSGTSTLTYYYARDNNDLYIFSPSPTDSTKWIYTFQTESPDVIALILTGATTVNRSELDAPINQIQTILSSI